MGNLKIFTENNIVRADISGSTALANYPAVNVRHPSPSTVCRLDTGTEGYIDIDLSNQTTKRFTIFGRKKHGLRPNIVNRLYLIAQSRHCILMLSNGINRRA